MIYIRGKYSWFRKTSDVGGQHANYSCTCKSCWHFQIKRFSLNSRGPLNQVNTIFELLSGKTNIF